jgi:hypothetical protein
MLIFSGTMTVSIAFNAWSISGEYALYGRWHPMQTAAPGGFIPPHDGHFHSTPGALRSDAEPGLGALQPMHRDCPRGLSFPQFGQCHPAAGSKTVGAAGGFASDGRGVLHPMQANRPAGFVPPQRGHFHSEAATEPRAASEPGSGFGVLHPRQRARCAGFCPPQFGHFHSAAIGEPLTMDYFYNAWEVSVNRGQANTRVPSPAVVFDIITAGVQLFKIINALEQKRGLR